ncbi:MULTISPECIES: hypothetical protein [Rhizobium]|uniref:hypothetical protein n=1 Tax=Rhizobium TaxID=379 RepID=UPI0019824816|nr:MULTISPECIES: hypothetical protein [Rhizobium]MDU0306090.1 hypothetical protein [Rhizobium sp. 10PS4]
MIDHGHDLVENIVPDLCDRSGVNRKNEFVGANFQPGGFQGHRDASATIEISARPMAEPNGAYQAHIAATVA